MCLVFLAFTSRSISLLVTNRASVFFFMVCVCVCVCVCTYSQHINIISTNQKLMCNIQIQPLLICLTLSGEIF